MNWRHQDLALRLPCTPQWCDWEPQSARWPGSESAKNIRWPKKSPDLSQHRAQQSRCCASPKTNIRHALRSETLYAEELMTDWYGYPHRWYRSRRNPAAPEMPAC